MTRAVEWWNVVLMVCCILLGIPLAYAISIQPFSVGGDIANQAPAWAQAFLTAATFAAALFIQERNRIRAEKKALAIEVYKSRAYAITLKTEIQKFASVIITLRTHGHADSPKEAFEEVAPNLTLRLRGLQASELREAAVDVMAAVHGAELLYSAFELRKDAEEFGVADMRTIDGFAEALEAVANDAMLAIENLIYGPQE